MHCLIEQHIAGHVMCDVHQPHTHTHTASIDAVCDATRGLKTALIEREDFASGTSSKSTKLVHGGVRYLEKAVFNLDYGQLKLVYEALQERKDLLDNAPHLTSTLPILMPCYKFWEVPFYWAGLKAYDLVAGTKNLAWSKYLAPSESERRLPTLAPRNYQGKSLKGTVSEHRGRCDLSEMCRDEHLPESPPPTAPAMQHEISTTKEAQA
jgi:glycerol-3-phosphate dehydrogenase